MNRRDFVSASLGLATGLATRAVGSAPDDVPRRFDVAIVGAGLFGSAAARHLSQVNDSVALIGPAEPARPRAHQGVFGSHYDVSRLTRIVDPDPIWATLAKRSIARYREIEERSAIGFYREIGYMMVTPGGLGADWFDLPAMREVASDLEVPIEVLDDASLGQRFPYLRFTPGSGAIVQPRNAGYIDPRMLLDAQQRIGIARGATLIRDEVVQLKTPGKQIEVGLRSGDVLYANRVLVATGAYANAAKLLPRELEIDVRAAMIMLSEVAPDTPRDYPTTLYAKTDGEANYWGLLMPPIAYPDGRTYVKTMAGYYGARPLEGRDEIGQWMRGTAHEDHHHVLERALREVFPALDVRSQRFQPCLIADTVSRYPYIDMLDDRIGVVVGGNGKAAKSSDEIGRIAAGMIGTGEWPSSLPQSLFAARFG